VVAYDNIKNLSRSAVAAAVAELGEPRHRTAQLFQWLYKRGATTFLEMTNLPLRLRELLAERFEITTLRCVDSVRSTGDASQKFLLESDTGSFEAVLMYREDHRTVCISSQIGCPLRCSFCRTGEGGFERNLRCDEILNQILFFKDGYLPPRKRFNIVLMGMGEPLLNTENVRRAIETLNDMDAFALGEKRITLSTIGIPARIDELTASSLRFGLAVSLNASREQVRQRVMPDAFGIRETLAAAERFAHRRGGRVTIEYVLLAGVNDSPADADELVALTRGRPFKINLIPFNEWSGSGFSRPPEERLQRFIGRLLPRAPAVTIRRSQGGDIDAACGQLRIRKLRK
jgi:23S rRNA (adenine2503-C2)-methyltransferase